MPAKVCVRVMTGTFASATAPHLQSRRHVYSWNLIVEINCFFNLRCPKVLLIAALRGEQKKKEDEASGKKVHLGHIHPYTKPVAAPPQPPSIITIATT